MIRRKQLGLVSLAAIFLLVVTASIAWAASNGQGQSGDQVVWGGNYTLRSGQELTGALTVMGGNASVEEKGVVRRDVVVMGGNLDVAGTIRGNVTIWGGNVALQPTAVVQGDVWKFGGSLDRADGATVAGQTREGLVGPGVMPRFPQVPFAPAASVTASHQFRGIGEFIGWQAATVGWGLLLALLGVAAVLLAPQHVSRVASAAAREPALSFGLGLLTIIVAVLVGGLLLIAFCLGLLVWLAALLALLLGWIAVGLWIGQRILSSLKVRDPSSLLEVALGVFLLTVLARLPWCGFLVWLLVGSLGVGAVLLTRFGSQPYYRPAGGAPGGGSGGRGPVAPVLPASAPDEPYSAANDFVPDPPAATPPSATVVDAPTVAGAPSAGGDFVPDPPDEPRP